MRGLSTKELYNLKYRRLKKIQNQLAELGIQCKYQHLEIIGPRFVIYFASPGRGSNGESFHYLVLRFNAFRPPNPIVKGEGDTDFTDFHTRDIPEHNKGGFEAGIQQVLFAEATAKELFS